MPNALQIKLTDPVDFAFLVMKKLTTDRYEGYSKELSLTFEEHGDDNTNVIREILLLALRQFQKSFDKLMTDFYGDVGKAIHGSNWKYTNNSVLWLKDLLDEKIVTIQYLNYGGNQ